MKIDQKLTYTGLNQVLSDQYSQNSIQIAYLFM
jgi:hypothetical protein